MTSSMKTVLVLGGTSGIGEAFARQFHSQGKRVIISGRRQNRLDELKAELKGLETYVMDITDFKALPGHVEQLMTKTYPDIDTVWVNAGVMNMCSFKEKEGFSDESVQNEIDTNITAPTLLARHFIPYLIARGTETNFLCTSSGTAFLPVSYFPIYCSSKAFVHSFMVALRQQLADTKVNVVEIVPPLVATGVGTDNAAAGRFQAMTLEDYTNETFKILDGNAAKDLKEVSVGTGASRVEAWREGPGKLLESWKLGG